MSQVKSKIYLKIILEIKRQKHLIFLMLFVKKLISIMKKKRILKGKQKIIWYNKNKQISIIEMKKN